MKILYIIPFILSFSICSSYAQIIDQPPKDIPLIERRTVMLTNQYYILGEPVTPRRVVKLMKPYKDAHHEMRASRRWRFFSAFIAGTGLAFIASELVSASDNEGFNLANVGIGTGIFLVAVPLSIKADRKADKAINLYNARQSMLGSSENRIKLGLAVDDYGIGLRLKF